MKFTEVAPDVYSAAHDFVDGRNAVIFGHRRALAVDAGNYPKDGAATAGFIRSRGHNPDYMALTHGHGDHVLGASALACGEIFAHQNTPETIRSQIPGWVKRQGRKQAEIEAELPWPTVTFSDELRLDLGGKTVWLFPTPGHSPDGVSALVEEDAVLVGGDAVVTGIVPAIGDGNSRVLESSLRRLAQLDIRLLIPGHGPELYGVDAVRDWVEWEADYLAGVRQRVNRLLGEGRSPAEAAAAVTFDEFIGQRLEADQHNMPQRHLNTVEKIIQEESATPQEATIKSA
jgi:cyclase